MRAPALPFLLLIVEDDILLAEDLHDVFAPRLDAAPVLLRSLGEAMAYDSQPPGFAILDVDLGDGKVFPFADRLAAMGVPFMFLTGSRRQDLPERFRERPCMAKPYDEARLLAAVDARREKAQPA